MEKYLFITKTEARLLLRSRSYWVIHGLLVVIPLLFPLLPVIAGARGELMYTAGSVAVTDWPFRVLLPLIVLIVPILTGPAIFRGRGLPGELLWSAPLDSFVYLAGQFSGLLVGMLPGLGLQAAAWIVIDLFMPDLLSDWVWLYALTFTALTIVSGLALALLLAVVLRRLLPFLVGWVGVWIFLMVMIFGLEEFVPIQSTSYINIFFQPLKISPTLGLGPNRGLTLSMAAWFVGLSLAAILLALLLENLFDRRRSIRRRGAPIFAGLVGVFFLAAGGSGIPAATQAHRLAPAPLDIQADAWTVLRRDLQTEVDLNRGTLSGDISLRLEPTREIDSPWVVLKLNPGLRIYRVTGSGGQELVWRQVGEAVEVDLPGLPSGPVELELAWSGKLQLPYSSYGLYWYNYGLTYLLDYYQPQPAGAILFDSVGYLLRDGDWYPWPWIRGPHQAPDSRVRITVEGGPALWPDRAPVTTRTWEADLPPLVAAFPPGRLESGVYMGRLGGVDFVNRSVLLASGVQQALAFMGEQPPTQVAVAPYLPDLKWSGDVLLIPDGAGYFISPAIENLYEHAPRGERTPQFVRAAAAAGFRTWMLTHWPPPETPYVPMLRPGRFDYAEQVRMPRGIPYERWPDSLSGIPVSMNAETWQAAGGRWLQLPETLDIWMTGPRIVFHPTRHGQLSAVAFWLAVETAGPVVRQSDYELLHYFRDNKGSMGGREIQAMFVENYLPYYLDSREMVGIILGLQAWSDEVGQEEALQQILHLFQEQRGEDIGSLIGALKALTGVSFQE
jgi:hypothetical protein